MRSPRRKRVLDVDAIAGSRVRPNVLQASVSGIDVECDVVAVDRRRREADAVDRDRVLGLGALALDALAAHAQRRAAVAARRRARRRSAIGDESAKHRDGIVPEIMTSSPECARLRSKRSAHAERLGRRRASTGTGTSFCRESRRDRPVDAIDLSEPRAAAAASVGPPSHSTLKMPRARSASIACAQVELAVAGAADAITSATSREPVEPLASPAGASTIVFAYPATDSKTRLARVDRFALARDDAHVRPRAIVRRTHRQLRIVDAEPSRLRPTPRREAVAQLAHVAFLARRAEPLSHAGPARDRAVERHRHLQRDVRPFAATLPRAKISISARAAAIV